MHVVCLSGLYPAVSHTFVHREIVALRAAGLRVTTCSVNRPGRQHLVGPEERAAFDATFYLLARLANPLHAILAVGGALARPRRLARALGVLRRSGATGMRGHLRQLAYLAEAMMLARYLRRRGADRVHSQLGMAAASVGMYAAILADVRFSLTVHGPDDFFAVPARQMAAKIAMADLVACISDHCRHRTRELCDSTDWPKLHLIRCGIDPDLYCRADRTAPLRRILFVGRLVAVKGVTLLIEAFGRVACDATNAVLTIAGDGPDRAALQAQASALGLGDRIVFAGALSQQQVASLMGSSDMLVLPSYAEGLPVVLMEALAAGLPVIATNVAGTPELVEDGVTGRLVAAGDVDQLTTAIAENLSDPAAALAMAQRGRTRVLRRHDMWAEGRRLAALFRSAHSGMRDPLA